jgi:NAD+ synthase (glutamine-hydrolysing)
MSHHGFLRVAAAVPDLRLADCDHNADRALALMARAEEQGVSLLVFPEMSLTGYTCHDLFAHAPLLRGAADALLHVAAEGARKYSGVAVVGLPLVVDDQVFNCAAVLLRGRILGVVPKSYLPTYKEFYDARYFSPASTAVSRSVTLGGHSIPFGPDLLFASTDIDGFTLGVEICEDLWMPIPPSSRQALFGATVLANLSASNETIGKANYRRQLVGNQSARCLAAYVYAAAGIGESTTDIVFGGHCLICENGSVLAESPRFRRDETLLAIDTDLERLRYNRLISTSFNDAHNYPGLGEPFRKVAFALERYPVPLPLLRTVEAHPFVPDRPEELRERCEEIFQTQVTGLSRRLAHAGRPFASIGVSGGLDSTLALLVACKTMDALSESRARVKAVTLPGFGTTGRTRTNAIALMEQLRVSRKEIDIRAMCLDEMRLLGHKPFGIDLEGQTVESLTERLRRLSAAECHDLVFENVQARVRTNLLMNAGFVIGTGDLSELALGWCTYNADHMSMYNPNVSIPKTLVKFLVRWVAENEFDGDTRKTLLDIVDTEISPELLPAGESGQVQSTESSIGPYELHDFFLYHVLRYGASPAKILYLAAQAKFDREYAPAEVRKWLTVFVRRFFANQFKRSCLPDGPKVGSVSVSPRGDWRMPSDAVAALWLEELEG